MISSDIRMPTKYYDGTCARGQSRALFVVLCFFLAQVSCSRSEKTQCAKRQILNTVDLPEFYSDHCSFKTEGQNLSKTDCTVWDFGERDGYHDCSDLQFSLPSSSNVLGTEIHPYLESFPNFIISFRDIKWNYMQYRLQVDKSKVCHKVWFNSSDTLHQALRVSFACFQFGYWAANDRHDAELLVDVGLAPSHITSHAHFVMKVPRYLELVDPLNKLISIKEWIILVAVDDSHKPDLLVYWPTVPHRYNVSEYNIRINDDKPKVVNLASCQNGYCSNKLFGGYFSRNVNVSVQPVHKDCIGVCYSYSPVITLETYLPLYFTIPAVLVPILIVLFLIFSVYYFCCTAPQEPLKVLLLFDATTKHHCQVVHKLAEYLEKVCRVYCLVDNVEIPKTESQNPSKWLHKTIDEADSVLYVASPESYLDIRYSYYPCIVYEALALIEQYRSIQTDNRPGRFLVVVPPYCSKMNIPKSLQDVPHFYIPDELSWLLWSIYNQQCWVAPFTWMAKAYLQCCWCPGPMSAYKQHGTRLKGALGIAKAHKITAELEPLEGSMIEGTWIGNRGDRSDNITIGNYPGILDALSLSGNLGGSLASKDEVSPKMIFNVDTLDL